MTSNPRGPRIGNRFRRFAIVAFIVLIPVAGWSAWDYAEARRFTRLVAEIQSRGEPVTTSQYQFPRGPAEANAARYYQAAAALVFSTDVYKFPGLARALAAGGTQHDEALAAARAWLAKHAEAEALLSRATDLAFLGNEGPLRRVDPISRLDRLASTRRLERMEAGDADAAARALTQQVKVARLAPAGEFMTRISLYWVTLALRDLPRLLALRPSTSTLTALHEAIAEQDRDDFVEQFATGFRANELQSFWNPSTGWYRSPSNSLAGPAQVAVRPWAAHQLLEDLQVLTDFVAHARKPWPDRITIEAPEAEPSLEMRRNWLGVPKNEGWLPYWFRRSARELAAYSADLRVASTVLAVELYRRDNGQIPDNLDQLVPHYMGRVPVDPFSGHALVYRPAADAFVVYSIGNNEVDDGGKIERPEQKPGREKWPLDVGLTVSIPKEMTR